VHASGRAARDLIETARAEVARLVGGSASRVVFTSGGAEANGLAIESAPAAGAKRILVSAIEHVTAPQSAYATGLPVEIWPVTGSGLVDLGWLQARLAAWAPSDDRPFVALMLANNETGAIQPVAEAGALVRAAGGLLHVDAVQGAGKIAVDIQALNADSLSLSAHKLGGPQGSGALVYGERAVIKRRIHGGGHEQGLRAGTENLSGIAGFGAAARAALRDLSEASHQAVWRDAAAERLKASGAEIAAEDAPRLPGVLNLVAEGFSSQTQVIALDLAGVMVSAGSACSSGKVTPSGVLEAMGYGALAGCALRASGGWSSVAEDWERFAQVWVQAYERQKARKVA
jgi:cysteine desulfurase